MDPFYSLKINFLSVREEENINIQISYLVCRLELADSLSTGIELSLRASSLIGSHARFILGARGERPRPK